MDNRNYFCTPRYLDYNTDLFRNDIDVQLSWTPGRQTHFIVFINKETEENHEYTDYRFSIQDAEGKKMDLQSPHSEYGVEAASYTFEKEGEFKPRTSIFSRNYTCRGLT
jgi:hypothetical protein